MSRAIEQIVKYFLFHGRYPIYQTITHYFSDWLTRHNPGEPSFNPKPALKKQKTSSENYNSNIKQIDTDLNDAYEATIDQNNRVMTNFSAVETERQKLIQQLDILSSTIDELLMVSGNADFKDFDGKLISFENADQVNQEESTVLLDLPNKQVTLKENTNQVTKVKVNPDRVTFKALMPAEKISALTKLSGAFDDQMNTAWWQIVKTKTPGSTEDEGSYGMRAQLDINFDALQTINEIRYIAHNNKPVTVSINYTMDGQSFSPLPGKDSAKVVNQTANWQFQSISVKGIRFIFEKKEHDDLSAGMYQYYFGAKDISFLNRFYQQSGVLYTQPIAFSDSVKRVTLKAKHTVPANTDIQYQVALYDAEMNLDALNWYAISSYDETNPKYATIVQFNTKKLRVVNANKIEKTGEVINSELLFRLLKPDGEGIVSQTDDTGETFDSLKSAQLFRGINQWKREKTYLPFTGAVPLNSQWDPIAAQTPALISEKYLPLSNELPLNDNPADPNRDNFFRFTICIYAEHENDAPLGLSMLHTINDEIKKRIGTYSIYLNRERLITENDQVQMHFQKGWNEIVLLYWFGDTQKRSDFTAASMPVVTYLGQFNFAGETKVRAELLPMTYTDEHNLFYNIAPNNHDYFTIHEQQVCFNYNPQGCNFQLLYETDLTSGDLENDLENNQVIVRALMSHEAGMNDITPAITNIQLHGK
jgi:hypothetical protein